MKTEVFNCFPQLSTERLVLREMNGKDSEGVYKFNSEIRTLEYVPRNLFTDITEGIEKTKSFIKGFYSGTALWWAFTLKHGQDSSMIGYGGLFSIDHEAGKAELGYGLLEPFWGKGYASEAVSAIVNFGFNIIELHRICALIDPGNFASQKVVEKLGFEKEGMLRDDSFARVRYFDMNIYALLNE